MISQLGRFTLRDQGRTIGSGKVLRYIPKDIGKAPIVVLNDNKHEETKGENQTFNVPVDKDLIYD